jgi:hypothetical protein
MAGGRAPAWANAARTVPFNVCVQRRDRSVFSNDLQGLFDRLGEKAAYDNPGIVFLAIVIHRNSTRSAQKRMAGSMPGHLQES